LPARPQPPSESPPDYFDLPPPLKDVRIPSTIQRPQPGSPQRQPRPTIRHPLERDDDQPVCSAPNWECDEGFACNISDDDKGICVPSDQYDKSLHKITHNGQKMFGSQKAIRELKKTFGIDFPIDFKEDAKQYYRDNDTFVDIQTLLDYLEPVQDEISKKSLTLHHLQSTLKGSKMPNVSLQEFYEHVYTPWASRRKDKRPISKALPIGKTRPDPPSTPDPLKKDPGTPTYTPPETPEVRRPISVRPPDFSEPEVRRPKAPVSRPPDFSEPEVRRPKAPVSSLPASVSRPPYFSEPEETPLIINRRKRHILSTHPDDETPVIVTGETSKFKEEDIDAVLDDLQEEKPDKLQDSIGIQDAIAMCLGLTGR
jgi:hypothetical protein